ncbi:divalent-cation tolerance protein CutA [Pyrococcus furiosus DSM 3638]|uniref:Divalent-cation tolerance protein CutA n=3 Tax=Pyrococcus furiosus TaxID=2261 RepID=A0A5C0XR23_PYRFU|nr:MULTISPECIES: divalent-cation tolerance protein CutA [Pyrococcus]AAL81155.1 divalent cation tolerance protein [Pyrococcus furiosus DSM 3638]QEK79696.1 divalent-cation tolerance protein CutA [Pyrococcus furiosus DSM 3638]
MIIIYTTFPTWESAEKVTKALLEERLVACANLREHKAFYWWQGKIEEDNEIGVILKTREDLWEEVKKRIKELHPYTVPAIIKINVEDVNEEYLKWLLEETKST